jgi:hypothetical protein
MLPFLFRKYAYYIVLALALPVIARLCLYASRKLEQRAGSTTKSSTALRKIGEFSQRRSDRRRGKHAAVESDRAH